MNNNFNPNIENMTRIPYFRRCVIQNFPFIEKDFDAVTDYQLLSKVVEYLNKVIKQQNIVEDNMSELIRVYEELKNYVEHYFDNLDVQTEINNKLDQMVEDGTLQEIIASYLNSKAVFGFDTVASMKSSTNLIDGSYAKTLGYYAKNDGGSALYKIRTITNDDVVDEQFIIALDDNTLIAELIHDDTINILQIGCKNDNSTDIGTVVNSLLNKNLKVYIPKGEYKVTNTINIPSNSNLVIDGNLNYTGNDCCIKIDSTARSYVKTKNITTDDGMCLVIEANTDHALNNVINLDGVITSNNNHCIYLHAVNKGIGYNEISFRTVKGASDKYSIYLKTEASGSNIRWINENIISGGQVIRGVYGLYIETGATGSSHEINGMKFNNISFEGPTNAIYISNARNNVFNYPRVGEISGTWITLASGANGNQFYILSNVTPDKINTSNLNNTSTNFIYCQVVTSGGTKFGKDFVTYNKKLQLVNLLCKREQLNLTDNYVDISEDENPSTITFNSNMYGNYILCNAGYEPEITLNQYYGSRGINDIYLILRTDRHCKIYDSYGTLIVDNDGSISSGTYHYICVNASGSDSWKKV